MKCLIVAVLIASVFENCQSQTYFTNPAFNNNQVINSATGTADFPLCFPAGAPFTTFGYACYYTAEEPGAYTGSLPCLPPILANGQIVVPCDHQYVAIMSYSGPLNNNQYQ